MVDLIFLNRKFVNHLKLFILKTIQYSTKKNIVVQWKINTFNVYNTL